MPRPHERTRSKKRALKTLPSGIAKIHYKKRVGSFTHCRFCGQPLAGTSSLSSSMAGKLNRSKRRIWRPYGGQACPKCLKNALKDSARAL